ncbi:MAG: helix-turn-helix domain-containing protein [Sulfuricaulis sp.]
MNQSAGMWCLSDLSKPYSVSFFNWYRGSESNRQGFVAFLPYVPVSLKALKPKPFPETPQTPGEHLKRCRLSRGLTLPEAAGLLGVDFTTVHHWEKGKTAPSRNRVPVIVWFLGYDLFP